MLEIQPRKKLYNNNNDENKNYLANKTKQKNKREFSL